MKKVVLLISAFVFTFMARSQNQNISKGNLFEGEPYLAINPKHPERMVVAWMGFVFRHGSALSIKVKTSLDAGKTWGSAVVMPHMSPTWKSADPSMGYDENGNLFLCYIDYREDPDSGGVYVLKSTDDGRTWGNPVQAINAMVDTAELPLDRPWMAVSPKGDRIYLTTKPAPWIPAPNRAYYTWSNDGGNSFKPIKFLDSTGYFIGTQIAEPMASTGAAGQAMLSVYPSFVPSQSVFARYILAKSNNPDQGFKYTVIYNASSGVGNDSAKLGYRLLTHPKDTMKMGFAFYRANNNDIDIYFTSSDDGGSNWTTPIKVNDDLAGTGIMQDMVWGQIDDKGNTLLTWRDRRKSGMAGYQRDFQIYGALKPADSAFFRTNFIISDSTEPYTNILNQSGNDFMGSELKRDSFYAVWGSTRDGSLDIYFAKGPIESPVSNRILIPMEKPDMECYPNPAQDFLSIKIKGISKGQLTLIDMDGKIVRSQEWVQFPEAWYVGDLSKGAYLLLSESELGIHTKKILIQ